MDIAEYIKQQVELHPSMQAQDVTKLCYQAAFGAEHLFTKDGHNMENKIREYFYTEYETTSGEFRPPLYEKIWTDVCRVNLAAWKYKPEWLFDLFMMSANASRVARVELADKTRGRFNDFMETAKHLGFAVSYDPNNIRPVHHSAEYREKEKPAYRVISGSYTRLIPILYNMAKRAEKAKMECGEACKENAADVVAIDGRAASGKTTMAAHLAAITGAGVIHMDDFFLPMELRTPERFAKPGGNIHHERFAEEVLPFLKSGKAFSYQKFDCAKMKFNGVQEVTASPWRVIEGTYSNHPILENYMDLAVFSDITVLEQMARIERRDGEKRAKEYASKWIPLEEEYFQTYQIKESADIRV